MKVLVCGGCRFKDKEALYRHLDALHAEVPLALVMNGGARGADYFASQWARERCIQLKVFRADWKNHGDEAVMKLNHLMLETGQPDLILAFPGGPVTEHMITLAEAAGVKVVRTEAD